MSAVFPKWTNRLPVMILTGGLLTGTAVVAGMWYYLTPKYSRVGYQPVQLTNALPRLFGRAQFPRSSPQAQPHPLPGGPAVARDQADLERISFRGTIDAARRYSAALLQARHRKVRLQLWEDLRLNLVPDQVPFRLEGGSL